MSSVAHHFFTSYARLDNNKYSKLNAVVEGLKERVRAKLGARSTDQVAFFDTRAIKTGAEWEKFLGDALRRSRVLVCFCSPTYFNSPFCAKEFEVFRRRLERAGETYRDARVVLPVIWDIGSEGIWLPQSIQKYQFTDKRFPDRYTMDGLCALKRVKGQRENYVKAIEVLADIITAASSLILPPWSDPIIFDQLPQSFHNPNTGPYNLAVIVLNEKGTQWVPAEDGIPVARTIEVVVSSLKVP